MSGYYNMDNVPPLLQQFIKQYQQQAPPMPDYPKPSSENLESPTSNFQGDSKSVYEINSKADLEYIKPEESGRKQIFLCEAENKVYVGKYNHVRKKMDYKSYTGDGEINLFQQNDNSAVMDKISEALVMIANKLDSMDKEIQAIKPSPYPINKHKKTVAKEDEEC